MIALTLRWLACLTPVLLAAGLAHGAETRYVTDEFEVTLRTGASLQNNILRMLKSGDAVLVIEEDPLTKYSLVETGEQRGYVLSRFLVDEPAARSQVADMRERLASLDSRARQQSEEIADLRQNLERERADTEALKAALLASEQELAEVRATAAETFNIFEQNKHLQSVVGELRREKQALTDTNAELSDSTQIDWFVRGGAVSLIAFVIGILVTRIRWRKRDSWGSY